MNLQILSSQWIIEPKHAISERHVVVDRFLRRSGGPCGSPRGGRGFARGGFGGVAAGSRSTRSRGAVAPAADELEILEDDLQLAALLARSLVLPLVELEA